MRHLWRERLRLYQVLVVGVALDIRPHHRAGGHHLVVLGAGIVKPRLHQPVGVSLAAASLRHKRVVKVQYAAFGVRVGQLGFVSGYYCVKAEVFLIVNDI